MKVLCFLLFFRLQLSLFVFEVHSLPPPPPVPSTMKIVLIERILFVVIAFDIEARKCFHVMLASCLCFCSLRLFQRHKCRFY